LTSKASAPGKIILFGEHFVVHGVKAVLGAINKRVTVISKKNETQSILIKSSLGEKTIPISESLENIDSMFKPFFFIAKKIINENSFSNGIDIEIQSEIPIGAGLGSSSACCVAAAASISNLFSNLQKNQILDLAIAAEQTIFPNTSGADCTVSVFGGIIDYQKDSGYKIIETEHEFDFIVVNSKKPHSTNIVVDRVNKFKNENKEIFNDLCDDESKLIKQAVMSLQEFDLETIGKCMSQNQIFLEQIGVSNDLLLAIVKLVEKFTFGAKITGAGDGGCIIALTDKNKKESIIQQIKTEYEAYPVIIDKIGMQVFNTN
tara:strand:- start:707 stop:1660 length:954 start_codon:yes stop_codon:yes gene_type:complete